MSGLPVAGIGEEDEKAPLESPGLWARARVLAGEKLSYALADQVAYSFGNMVVAALLSRHCAQREFGIYILTQRALDVILQLCNVFLWGPFVYNLPGTSKPRQPLYLGSVLVHQLVCCGLAAVGLWGAGRWASTPARGMYYGVFAPLVLTSIGIVFREFTRRMYFAEMRFKEAFWTEVATVGLQIVGVEWLYLHHELNVPNSLWMLSLGAIAVSLWWLVREWGTFKVGVSECWQDLRLNLHLGRSLLGANMVYMMSSQANPWVLSWLLGGAAAGSYAICESVVNIPRVALTSMQNMMAPMMARAVADGGKPALRKMVLRMDRLLVVGAVVFGIGVVTLGPWIEKTIFKRVPEQSVLILMLLALNFVVFSVTLAQSFGLTAIDRAGHTFYANISGLLLQVMVTVWLIKRLQVPGAAAALVVGSLGVVAVRAYFYAREMREA